MDKKYRFKKGSRITGDGQAVGDEFERMSSTVGLTTSNVVAAAKDRDSILHPYFTWNKTEGYQKNLLAEAQRLMNSIEVYYVTVDHHILPPVRAFVAVGPVERRMLPMIEVMQDDEYRQKLLSQAFSELASFTKKYRNLKELAEVFMAIDALPKNITGRVPPSSRQSSGMESRV